MAGRWSPPVGRVTVSLPFFPARCRRWRRPERASFGSRTRWGPAIWDLRGGWGRVRGEGDSFFAVFPGAWSAVEAAGASQLRLEDEVWPANMALRVRMGLHTGE